MGYLLQPLRVIYKIYYLIFFSVSLFILFPLFYFFLSDSGRFPRAFALMRRYAFVLILFAGVRIKVKGIENIPKKGPYIICPNHTSFLDIFCIYCIFSQYFVFTGKKEIEKWPLFHIFYTSGMNILVDRHSKTGSIQALKRMSAELNKGNPIVIFPEGTISKEAPKLAPFKPGAFAVAIQNKVPVLPVTFVTNWRLLQRCGIWKGKAGPGIAEVIIHKPVQTVQLSKENAGALQNKVQEIIQSPFVSI